MALNVCSVQTPRMRFIIIYYIYIYYSSSMHEADLFLGHLVFLEILCIAYFFTSFAHLYPTEK